MSSAAETSRSDAEVEEFLRRCAATAAAGVDVNDIRDWMVTKLPRKIWLQLNANYPDGEYYHPDLSVNKHLGISYDLLKELLGSDWGRDLKWGGKGNKGVVVRAGTRDSLRRQSSDQIDAVWIWVDPTFAIPRRRPGEQIPPKDPLRIGDWRELDEKTQKEARQQYDNGDFGSCISVPDGGWASRDDHVKHDKHAEVTAGSKRSRKSSEKGLSAVGVFFDDPIKAAGHVAEVWDNVGSWWNDPDVRDAVEAFSVQFCRRSPDVLDEVRRVLVEVSRRR